METVEHIACNIFRTNKRVFIPYTDLNRSADEFDRVNYYIQRRTDLEEDKGVERLNEDIYITDNDDTAVLQSKLEKYVKENPL